MDPAVSELLRDAIEGVREVRESLGDLAREYQGGIDASAFAATAYNVAVFGESLLESVDGKLDEIGSL